MNKKIIFITVCLAMTGLVSLQAQHEPVNEESRTFTGYFNMTDLGMMIGSPNNQRPAPFSFMTVNGYHFTKQLSVGVGIGLEFPVGSYMPMVLDARYYLRDSNFTPFLFCYGGYMLPLDDSGTHGTVYYDSSLPWVGGEYKPYEPNGGWLFNPGFGIRQLVGDNFGVVFSVGYRIQRLYYEAGDDRSLMVDSNRLMIKMGITFR